MKFYKGRPASWIRVSGEDSPGFLQSQFSNDLNRQLPDFITYGLWLDRKGKVQADSFVLQAGPENFQLFSYFSTADTIINKLQANIIADDVELRDETESMASICWWGEKAEDFLEFLDLEEPVKDSFLPYQSGFILRGRRSLQKNFDLIVKNDEIKLLTEKITEFGRKRSLAWVGDEALKKERISAEIPAVPFDIGPRDFPQEGGLGGDAVCYEKGCYLGQEVMARLHTRGRTRRQLFLVGAKEDVKIPPLPCELFGKSGSVGQLRSAVNDDTGFLGLALLKTSQIDVSAPLGFFKNAKPLVQFQNNCEI